MASNRNCFFGGKNSRSVRWVVVFELVFSFLIPASVNVGRQNSAWAEVIGD